jgi:hypothetical protein
MYAIFYQNNFLYYKIAKMIVQKASCLLFIGNTRLHPGTSRAQNTGYIRVLGN